MDPLTLSILAATAVVEGAIILAYYLRRRRRGRVQAPAAPSPQPPAPTPPPTPPPPPPKRWTMEEIVAEVVSHMAISRQRVQVGWRMVGTRVIGESFVERPYPAHELTVRPIHAMDEFPQLLPEERSGDSMVQTIRAVSGEALVGAYRERVPLREPVQEPEYRDLRKVAYLLLDVSPSMFGDTGDGRMKADWWMIPIWRGIALALLHRARREDALFILRCFGGSVADRHVANSEESERALAEFIRSVGHIGSTDIGRALRVAVEDFAKERYDVGDVMILTDGEDHGGFDPAVVQKELVAARLRLHAILLGVRNDRLRRAADVYQEIPEAGVVRPPVRR